MTSSAASWMLRNYDNVLQNSSSIIKEHGQDGEKLVEIAGKVKEVSENYDYTKEQSVSTGIGGNVGFGNSKGSGVSVGAGKEKGSGGALGMVKNLFQFGASVSADGKLSNSDRQGLSEKQNVIDNKQTDRVYDVMNQYSKHNDLNEGKGSETSDSKTFNQSYDSYKQKQEALESMQSESKQLQSSIASIKSKSFMANETGIQGFINYFANRLDKDSVFENARYGERKAIQHILKRDDTFKSIVKDYTLHQEGANAKRRGTEQYLAEYNKESEYSNNIIDKIDSTNIEDKTKSTIPPD